MKNSVMDAKHFHDEKAAFAYLEARIWSERSGVPHCGGVDRIGKMKGKSTRVGVYKCYQCRKSFRATVGTVFEASHIPLRLWLQAVHLMAASRKGASSNQLHRILGVTLKTAWFMSHRIREAMKTLGMASMGGAGETVEVDETFIGNLPGWPKPPGGYSHKNAVPSLVNRTTGEARTFHIGNASVADILSIVRANVKTESEIMTDEARYHLKTGAHFAAHGAVNHSLGEYGVVLYGHTHVHTNTIEGFFSIFKRGMKGVYQHCSEKHLHRYLVEFDFC